MKMLDAIILLLLRLLCFSSAERVVPIEIPNRIKNRHKYSWRVTRDPAVDLHYYAAEAYSISDQYIHHINSEQKLWRAGRNFPHGTPLHHLKRLMGVKPGHKSAKLFASMKTHSDDVIKNLPESFDARDRWPYCSTLKEIRDQGTCGSCWAISAVETMSDRICIHSNGSQQVHLSVQDLLTCDSDSNDFGCLGSDYLLSAWIYWKKSGIVSGGQFNSSQGCQPYTIPPCALDGFCLESITPTCVQECRYDYNVSYEDDKYYGKEVYAVKGDEDHIMGEIYNNGPVEASLKVHEDFMSYKSGVYVHTKGTNIGLHAVKIIGWGVEDSTKYWLVANSWNYNWGDNGFFKILRGEDHCDIESDVVAGLPLLEMDDFV